MRHEILPQGQLETGVAARSDKFVDFLEAKYAAEPDYMDTAIGHAEAVQEQVDIMTEMFLPDETAPAATQTMYRAMSYAFVIAKKARFNLTPAVLTDSTPLSLYGQHQLQLAPDLAEMYLRERPVLSSLIKRFEEQIAIEARYAYAAKLACGFSFMLLDAHLHEEAIERHVRDFRIDMDLGDWRF